MTNTYYHNITVTSNIHIVIWNTIKIQCLNKTSRKSYQIENTKGEKKKKITIIIRRRMIKIK